MTLRSSFVASSGIFDISVELLHHVHGMWRKTCLPIADIGPMVEIDDETTHLFIKSLGQYSTVRMGYAALKDKFKNVDLTTGTIDLTAHTGITLTAADKKLVEEFARACGAGGDYIMLRVYAAPDRDPDNIRDTMIHLKKSIKAEPRSKHEETRTFLGTHALKDEQSLEVRIPFNIFQDAVSKAGRGDYLDLRAFCSDPPAPRDTQVVMRL